MTRNDTLIRRKFYQYLMPGVLMVVWQWRKSA